MANTAGGLDPALVHTSGSDIVFPNIEAVTPSDTNTFDCSVVRVGSAGTLAIKNKNLVTVDYGTVAAGEHVIGLCRGVMSTGTTATSITRAY